MQEVSKGIVHSPARLYLLLAQGLVNLVTMSFRTASEGHAPFPRTDQWRIKYS
jgi:hypothetical protein